MNSWVFGGLEGGLDWVSGGLLASAAVNGLRRREYSEKLLLGGRGMERVWGCVFGPRVSGLFSGAKLGLGKVVAFGQCILLVLGCFFNLKSGLCE